MGGDCNQPVVVTETVSITVRDTSTTYRLVDQETVYLNDAYDMDTDGVMDFALTLSNANADLELLGLNAARFIVLEDTAISPNDRNANLEECRYRFMYDPSTEALALSEAMTGTYVCVQTGAGRVGYIRLDAIAYDANTPDLSSIGFLVYSEVP